MCRVMEYECSGYPLLKLYRAVTEIQMYEISSRNNSELIQITVSNKRLR